MKILQRQRKVSKAAKVTLSSVHLITLFEERLETWTCDTFLLGLLQWRSPVNDSLIRVYVWWCHYQTLLFVNEKKVSWKCVQFDCTLREDEMLLIMVIHITALINNNPELEYK